MKHRGVEIRINSANYYCESMEFEMSFMWHHKFEALFVPGNDMKFDIKALYLKPVEFIITDFYGDRYSLNGVITDLSVCSSNSFFNKVRVCGASSTILMDIDERCSSFMNTTVKALTATVLKRYSKVLKYHIENDVNNIIGNILKRNKYGKRIEKIVEKGIPYKHLETEIMYRAQFEQTDWCFINSVLRDYNIPAWYSGSKFIVGKGLIDNNIKTVLFPDDFLYLEDSLKDETVMFEMHNVDIDLGSAIVIKRGGNLSKKMTVIFKRVCYRDSVMNIIYKAVTSSDAGVNLSDFYDNRVVEKQFGVVVRNDDPLRMGRVQVQLKWQKKLGETFTTNWIRCMRSDAGLFEDGTACRGMFYIPEVGDNVIVSYIGNDYNDPYVSGCLYDSKSAKWEEDTNSIKVYSTRSGHRVVFDDSKGYCSLLIADKSGNYIKFDTNNNIVNIFSADKIHLRAKTICLQADEAVEIVSDNETFVNGKHLCEVSSDKISRVVSDDKLYLNASKGIEVNSKSDFELFADNNIELNGNGDFIVEHNKNCRWKGRGKIDIKSGVRVNVAKF